MTDDPARPANVHHELRSARERIADLEQRLASQGRVEEEFQANIKRLEQAEVVGGTGSWEYHVASGQIWGSRNAFAIYGIPLGPETNPDQLLPLERVEACISERAPVKDGVTERERVYGTLVALLTRNAPYEIEFSIRPESGEPERTIYSKATRIDNDNGQPALVVGTLRDVTEERRRDHALRQSETRLRLLTSQVSDVLWTMDLGQHITYISPSVESQRGYSPEEIIGRSARETFTPESYAIVAEVLREEITRDGQPGVAPDRHRTLTLEQRCKDGSVLAVEITTTFMRDEQGQVQGVVGVTRDVSERKRAEANKAKLEQELHQSRKMEAIGRLAGGVAHDFNNILCAISGNASLALADLPGEDPTYEFFTEIADAADRAAALTRQLLAFSRKQIVSPRVIVLSQVIDGLQAMLGRLIGEDILLRTVTQRPLGRVRADPGQIEQIVLNLALNARDAMPDGGELVIETTDTTLDEDYCSRHGLATAGPYVLLAVSDTGSGMSPKVRDRLFEPFFTTKELGHGTGLGLATVFGIVNQSGGRIEVYSEPGRGTSFRVYFPRVFDETEMPAPPTHAKPSGGDETVLVVEDEEIVRTMAVKLLERGGYRVLVARDGDDALALAERHDGPIDLLLTDVVMPRMNGHELAKKLVEARPTIKVLYTSGYTQNVIAHRGVLDEGTHYLAKPYSHEGLALRVREVLDSGE